ncbi:hypothetical protein EZS27_023215 [termite gut metagenome]|uniref:Uncharacterized protein n=1 Tax=termite gut metagenome TaxID=433724 RepID=A0A5J4R2P7_9ZZZZ
MVTSDARVRQMLKCLVKIRRYHDLFVFLQNYKQ